MLSTPPTSSRTSSPLACSPPRPSPSPSPSPPAQIPPAHANSLGISARKRTRYGFIDRWFPFPQKQKQAQDEEQEQAQERQQQDQDQAPQPSPKKTHTQKPSYRHRPKSPTPSYIFPPKRRQKQKQKQTQAQAQAKAKAQRAQAKPKPKDRSQPQNQPPLWKLVKQKMDNESVLRNKCAIYRNNLFLAKTANDKLKEKLADKERQVADLTAQVARLQAQKALQALQAERSKKALQAEQAELDAHRAQLSQRSYEVRVYKTALKAAFKIPGVGLDTQTTYRSILEATQRQIRRSSMEVAGSSAAAAVTPLPLAESALPRDDRPCGLWSEMNSRDTHPGNTHTRHDRDGGEAPDTHRGGGEAPDPHNNGETTPNVGRQGEGDESAVAQTPDTQENNTKKRRLGGGGSEMKAHRGNTYHNGETTPDSRHQGEGDKSIGAHTPDTKGDKTRKRRLGGVESNSDCDSVQTPAAKMTRLTPRRSARKIIHDD